MSEPLQENGLFASLRRLLVTALDIAQVRLELLSTEIELEKKRLYTGLLWGLVAMLVVGVGVVLFCGFVILLFWEGYRLAAVGVMAGVFLVSGGVLLRMAHQRLCVSGGLFSASVEELARDRDGLKS